MSVLAGLQQLAEQADAAPWTWLPDDSEESPRGWCRFGGESALNESGYATAPNAEFIAAARNAFPALLAVAAEARLHQCPLIHTGTATYPELATVQHSPHAEQSDEGTAYCRMCEALACLAAGETAE